MIDSRITGVVAEAEDNPTIMKTRARYDDLRHRELLEKFAQRDHRGWDPELAAAEADRRIAVVLGLSEG